ncbi:MAG: cyanophycin synthetase, partial [Pseudomonadota bacterium]
PAGERPVRLPLGGRHNVSNAAGAAAAALAAGATLDDVVAGLAALRAVPGRLAVSETAGGARVVDDSYNANPASLHSAMAFVAAASGPAWLVLGDMQELGDGGREAHAEVGERARQLGLARVYAVGPLSRAAVEAFGDGAAWFATTDALIAALRVDLAPGVTVLVKGSRAARLGRVARALLASDGEG